MCTTNHDPIIFARLPSTRLPPQDLYINERQISPDLVTLPLDDQQIPFLCCTNISRVDINGYTALGEAIWGGGGDYDASNPVDDGGRGGTVEDVLAVHKGGSDGYVRFDES